jgi:hypothetical protein
MAALHGMAPRDGYEHYYVCADDVSLPERNTVGTSMPGVGTVGYVIAARFYVVEAMSLHEH